MPMMYIKRSIWCGFEIKNWIEVQFQSSPKLVGIWTVQMMHFCFKFRNCNFNWRWVMVWTSSKWGKCSIWPWRSWSIVPQNNRALNQGIWSKFGDPSLNGWWIIARTSSWLTDTRIHTHTHPGNYSTRRPKLASGKNYCSKYLAKK